MLLRFVVNRRLNGDRHRLGIVRAAWMFLNEESSIVNQQETVRRIFDRFNEELPIPYRYARHDGDAPRALSWFKPTADRFIWIARRLARALDANDLVVHELLTDRPGEVVYEDDYQVVAVPFRGDTF